MAKVSFATRLKMAKVGLFLAKHYPKLLIVSALSGVGYYVNDWMTVQRQTLVALKESVHELKTQNQAIKEANESLVVDMQSVKKNMAKYQDRLVDIRESSRALVQQFSDNKFKQDIQDGKVKEAEKKFNKFFNEYMESFNEGLK